MSQANPQPGEYFQRETEEAVVVARHQGRVWMRSHAGTDKLFTDAELSADGWVLVDAPNTTDRWFGVGWTADGQWIRIENWDQQLPPDLARALAVFLCQHVDPELKFTSRMLRLHLTPVPRPEGT